MNSTALNNMKFRISSPEQSERLQKVLFELGYKWSDGDVIQLTGEQFLFASEHGYITFSNGVSIFREDESEEQDTEDFIAKYTFVTVDAEPPKRNKYSRQIKKDVWVDVYDVLNAFKVTSPTLQHLTKKALCAGLRGHKDERQDLVDILDSAKRALDMYDSRIKDNE